VALGPDRFRRIAQVMVECGLATSASDAARKIEQGGVRIDGERLADSRARVEAGRAAFTLQVGRNAVRVSLVA